MKICFVITEISLSSINSHTGGGGVFYSTLASKLRDAGHEVFICVFPDNDKDLEKIKLNFMKEEIDNFHVYNATIEYNIKLTYCYYEGEKHTVKYGSYLSDYIKDFCTANMIDVVECQDFYGLSQLLQLDIPVLVRLHTNITVISTINGCEGWLTDDVRQSENLALIMADGIAGVSQFIIDETRQNCDINKNNIYGVIYNAIDYDKFKYSDYSQVIGKRLIYIGSLNNKKGIDRLFKLFNEINMLDSEIELVLVGKGNLYEFEHILSSSAKSVVKHIQHVSHDEVQKLISSSSLFILASYHESFGLVVGESMSAGRAVFIYSDCPVFDEIVTDGLNGIIWKDIRDFKGAANKVVSLINNKNMMQEMGDNACNTIRKSFGINKLVLETEQWYKYSIENLESIRIKNSYQQKIIIRDLIIKNMGKNIAKDINYNLITIDGNIPLKSQTKQFIKQLFKVRGFNRSNIFSFKLMKKIFCYPLKLIRSL